MSQHTRPILMFGIAYGNVVHNGSSTSRLAHDSNLIFVAAEEMDVLLNPLQSHALIKQTSIRGAILLKRRSCEESESAQPVVYSNNDHVVRALCKQIRRIAEVNLGPDDISAAVDVHEDWSGAVALEHLFRHDHVE